MIIQIPYYDFLLNEAPNTGVVFMKIMLPLFVFSSSSSVQYEVCFGDF